MKTQVAKEPLALHGGQPVLNQPLRRYNPIGEQEVEAAAAVVRSGVLSQFLGSWGPDFYGGPKVQAFEVAWRKHFGTTYAVAVNSLTSGLIAALGAVGLAPGDEVIVSPWTMSASASAPLHWNAIPVFADIEPDTYCLAPAAVQAALSPRTRAILAVDIFGQSADVAALGALAQRHGVALISDSAQAMGARVGDRLAGTGAAIGGYSLNYHKHIHTGEGGVMVTDDAQLAERMQLIRNHAEAAVAGRPGVDLRNMLGHNFRLGEIEAAIGAEQLRRMPSLVAGRQAVAERLRAGLCELPGLQVPQVRPGCTHVYYVFALQIEPRQLGISPARLIEALSAEGVPHLAAGYANVHLLPIFQRRTAYGVPGFPWDGSFCSRAVDYRKGICPVAEELHDQRCFIFEVCQSELDEPTVDRIVAAFHKVWAHLDELR